MNLEEEFVSALCDLKKERKKNKHLKEELCKMKEIIQDSINPEETKKVFIDIKVKLKETKMIEETLRKKLEEKERIHVEMENEIVSLKGKLQSKDIKKNFDNNPKILDHIINNQISVYDKSGLGNNQNNTKMGSSSMVIENDKRSYEDIIQESIKKEDCEPLKEDIQKLEMKNKEYDHAWK